MQVRIGFAGWGGWSWLPWWYLLVDLNVALGAERRAFSNRVWLIHRATWNLGLVR